MSEIKKLLQDAKAEDPKDIEDLLLFFKAAHEDGMPLRVEVTEQGPTNGGKAKSIGVKLVREPKSKTP